MNVKQRIVIFAGAFAIVLLFLWPPCKERSYGGESHEFVFRLEGYRIYRTKLAVYVGLVVFVDIGLLWILNGPRRPTHERDRGL